MKQKQNKFDKKDALSLILALFLFVSGGCLSNRRELPDTSTAPESASQEQSTQEGSLPSDEIEIDEPEEEPLSEQPEAATRPMNPELENYVAQGDKLVALTFDDGPHEIYTEKLLEILGREEVYATFFLIGIQIEQNPEVAAAIAAGGHQIGNHTQNHAALTKLDADERRTEIDTAAELIRAVTGIEPFGLRPPYCDMDSVVKQEAGAPIILWSVDPEDWKNRDAHAVYSHVLSHVSDGSIVLMHDVHASSVEAVEWIIPALKEQGYRFVTVDELLWARKGELERGKVYSMAPPVVPTAD